MSHNHSHETPNSSSRLLSAIFINSIMVVFEMVLGVITGSMALVSDAVHNLSDISAMILGFWSEKIAKKPATNKKTYGYKKIEFITAFANSILLSVAIIYILYEAIMRFWNPVEVQSKTMFFVALIALIGNSIATFILQKTADQNFNLKAVWLHSLQDALLSLGVVIASIIIYFTNWNIVDPLISIVICIFIAREIYKIISHTINALLDSVPDDIDFEAVKQEILKIKNMEEVSDIHIWQTDSHQKMLSAHLFTTKLEDMVSVTKEVQKMLHNKYDIQHTTLQVFPLYEKSAKNDYCN